MRAEKSSSTRGFYILILVGFCLLFLPPLFFVLFVGEHEEESWPAPAKQPSQEEIEREFFEDGQAGHQAIAAGNYAEAADLYQKQLAATFRGTNPEPHYNLARARALMGDAEQTFSVLAVLEEALEKGFDDADRLESDAAFATLRQDERFGRIVEKARRQREGWVTVFAQQAHSDVILSEVERYRRPDQYPAYQLPAFASLEELERHYDQKKEKVITPSHRAFLGEKAWQMEYWAFLAGKLAALEKYRSRPEEEERDSYLTIETWFKVKDGHCEWWLPKEVEQLHSLVAGFAGQYPESEYLAGLRGMEAIITRVRRR